MQRDDPPPSNSKLLSSKLQIPRYSDKFKEIIAKSELVRQQHLPPTKDPQPPSPPTAPSYFFYRIKSIGVGAHSFVYLVQQQQTKILLAEKSVTKQHAIEIEKDLTREIKLLLHLQHQNIIKLYHLYNSETHINLVLQYAEDSLFALKQRFGTFKEKQIIEVLRQLLTALQYLHSKNVVHADVKLQNIMIANGTIKLCDFGLAHSHTKPLMHSHPQIPQQTHQQYPLSTKDLTLKNEPTIFLSLNSQKEIQVVGTLEYLPPEYAQGTDSGPARDIWAVGVLAFQMLVGKHPFDGLKQNQKWAKLVKHPPQSYCEELKEREADLGINSQKVEHLVQRIFQPWQKRWSAQQLLQMPLFVVSSN